MSWAPWEQMMGVIYAELHDEPFTRADTTEQARLKVADVLPEYENRRYPLLRLIDPYGDTFFSSFQMAGLIEELQQRHTEMDDPVIERLLELAGRCQSTPRSWLAFVGD